MAHDPDHPMSEHTGLTRSEIDLLATVLGHYPLVQRAVLFGSRAKGTARPNSDIDIALYGDIDDLTVERIASDLDDLPLPYLFDIKAVATLKSAALTDHIKRVGVNIYRS